MRLGVLWRSTIFILVACSLLTVYANAGLSETFDIPARDVDALVSAINEANSNDESDTINLAQDSLYTFQMPRTNPSTGGAFALPEIRSEITINANGSTLRRDPFLGCPASEDQNFGILAIEGLNEASGNLELSNAIISHGCQQEGSLGGGIFNSDGHLTIFDSFIAHNQRSSGVVNRGTIIVENSRLIDNFGAASGGGIRNSGTLNLKDSILARNRADSGGGVGNSGTATIVSTTVRNNEAPWGGGIANGRDGTMTVRDSMIVENEALYTQRGATALLNQGQINITRSLIAKNIAHTFIGSRREAVRVTAIRNEERMRISNSMMTRNTGNPVINAGRLIINFSTFFREAGLRNSSGTTRIKASVLVGSGNNCVVNDGTVESVGFNVSNDRSCNTNNIDDIVDEEITGTSGNHLENDFPFNDMTYYLPSLTDVVRKSDCTTISGERIETDIRGVTRPQDGDGDQTARCDVGALEAER